MSNKIDKPVYLRAEEAAAASFSREDWAGKRRTVTVAEFKQFSRNGQFVHADRRHRAELVYEKRRRGVFGGFHAWYTEDGPKASGHVAPSLFDVALVMTYEHAPREWFLGQDARCEYSVVIRSRSGRPARLRVDTIDFIDDRSFARGWVGAAFDEAFERPDPASVAAAGRFIDGWGDPDFVTRLTPSAVDRRIDIQTYLVALECSGTPYGDLAREIRERHSGAGALRDGAREFMVSSGARPMSAVA